MNWLHQLRGVLQRHFHLYQAGARLRLKLRGADPKPQLLTLVTSASIRETNTIAARELWKSPATEGSAIGFPRHFQVPSSH
jgi:hypothetical protein